MDARARFRVLRVVWLALTAGVVLYGTVAIALLSTDAIGLTSIDASVARPVTLGLVLFMVAALFVRGRLVAAIPKELTGDARLERYQVACIVSYGLIEAGGLGAITLGFLSSGIQWIAVGCTACVTSMLLARPRREEAGLV